MIQILFKKDSPYSWRSFFIIQTGAIYAESGKQKRWPLENRSYQQGN
jgi:hypothetical protein